VIIAAGLWITYGAIQTDVPLICSNVPQFMIGSYIVYKIYQNQDTPEESEEE
jgi:hypothetical protein